MRNAAILALLVAAIPPCLAQTSGGKTYPLQSWNNIGCRDKGRFQDPEYCNSQIIDAIVADRKSSIPILISQITDSRLIAEPIEDFWPRISAGELSYFILWDLFLDDTWTKHTIPDLFPEPKCDDPAWVCWANFRKTHSLGILQSGWLKFWNANKDHISWDAKARCFRLNE